MLCARIPAAQLRRSTVVGVSSSTVKGNSTSTSSSMCSSTGGGGAFQPTSIRYDSSKRHRHLNRLTPENAVNPLTKPLQMDSAALHVVSTPIGNIKDFTIRALEILRQCDYIVCTNRNATKALLDVVDIDYAGRLIHYGPIEERRVAAGGKTNSNSANKLVELLKGGRSMALVAPSGTPGVGDAGNDLIKEMMRSGIRISPVPGASSIIAGLTTSGSNLDNPAFDAVKGCSTAFPSGAFYFGGFLSELSGPRARQLRQIQYFSCPSVFYESPKRLVATLGDMLSVLGTKESYIRNANNNSIVCNSSNDDDDVDILSAGKGSSTPLAQLRRSQKSLGVVGDVPRRVSVCHEMTKFHEASHAGPIKEVYRYYSNMAGSKGLELGQLVVVVDGLDAELLDEFKSRSPGGVGTPVKLRELEEVTGRAPTSPFSPLQHHYQELAQSATPSANVNGDDALSGPLTRERRRELKQWLRQRRDVKRKRLLRAIEREQLLRSSS